MASKKMIAGRSILIDGDIIAFQVASLTQRNVTWNSDFEDFDEDAIKTVTTDVEMAWDKFKDMVENQRKICQAEHVVMTLSCPNGNWRKDVLPTYKHNRKGSEKPIVLMEIKDRAAAHYNTFIKPRLEADDVLGILHTNGVAIKGETVVSSDDKDLVTVPGLHFRPREWARGVFAVSEPEANRFHIHQTLTGDTTDGYKGCPGIGPKKADKLLADYPVGIPTEDIPTLWKDVIVPTFESKGLTEEDALVQARVARICRSCDYDFKKKEVKLWVPTRK